MCGICGEIRFGGDSARSAVLNRMCEVMQARGPDADGMLLQGRVGFAHRRLKIIDLSDTSHQPMSDPHLGLSIVFNGAIYNYRELRAELESKGYRFFSQGDTEVILKAYHAWGDSCVERFNGMFAFAISERDSGRVIFGRDRLGIKPFYYTKDKDGIRFASTLPALLKSGNIDTELDPVALNYYMSFHAVVPAPHTILKGVRKLPAATIATIEPNGEWRERRYWELSYEPRDEHRDFSFDDWKAATLDIMRAAVKRRLTADVPVGVLLSGGLDSSLIVGLLAEREGMDIETFSIGFETVGKEAGDEFRYSDIVSKRFGTNHHKLFIDSSRTLPALQDCIANMSEPMVSHDNIGFYLLSKEVSKFVKVVQSGQGADEIFGGYHWYPPMLQSKDPVGDYARVFFDRDFEDYGELMHPRFVERDYARDFVEQHFARLGASRAVDKALRIDTEIMLVDDPVKRVDNNTMAASLEARVPFLDHEVVEFAAAVPAELKVPDGGKYLLKEAARAIIPNEVIDRPKGYFPVPALKYLRGDFLEMARDAVTNQAARDRGLFQQPYVERLLADPEKHLTPLRGSKLWQLTLLELWLQKQGI